MGVDHGHEFVEELDDEEESDLPGDDGLQVGGEEYSVEMEHEITWNKKYYSIIYSQLNIAIM